MEQLTDTQVAESALHSLPQQAAPPPQPCSMWQAAEHIMDVGASAIGFPNGFHISGRVDSSFGGALVPLRNMARRLKQLRSASEAMGTQPVMIACTNAREAQSVTDDEDVQDRRYLTGNRTIDGSRYVYCGGIDAAISRALAYAPYADVVCYRASRLDFAEAQLFASAIRASFPGKQLGIGFSQCSHEFRRGPDNFSRDERLFRLGYGYHFLTVADSLVFPAFTAAPLWAFFYDGAGPGDVAEPGDGAGLAKGTQAKFFEPELDLHSLRQHRTRQNSKPDADTAWR